MDEKKKCLYHYTSQEGLLGILKNKNLWMTNVLYLNDSSEFSYVDNLINSELLKYKSKELVVLDLIEALLNYLRRSTENEIFIHVFSLSEKRDGDDISQWRAYCPNVGNELTRISAIVNHFPSCDIYS